MDFNSTGNTNELSHLITPFANYTPTRTDINFGFGLRKYKSINGFKIEKPWRIPKFKGLKQFDPYPKENIKISSLISNRESADGEIAKALSQTKRHFKSELKYSDKFPQRNASGIRHLFEKTCQIGSIKWQSGLRFSCDKDQYSYTSKLSKITGKRKLKVKDRNKEINE